MNWSYADYCFDLRLVLFLESLLMLFIKLDVTVLDRYIVLTVNLLQRYVVEEVDLRCADEAGNEFVNRMIEYFLRCTYCWMKPSFMTTILSPKVMASIWS